MRFFFLKDTKVQAQLPQEVKSPQSQMFLTYLIPLNKNIGTGVEFKRKSLYFGHSFERTQGLKLRTTHGPEIFSLISQDSQCYRNLKHFLVLALSSGSPNYILLTNGNFQ